jgi:two-component system, chemotaxis family, chemotaxis protein CheY
MIGEGPDILLVEDDLAVRESLVEILELEGFRVHESGDGAEALSWLRGGGRPRLVMLDLVMPYMGGGDFLRELRAEPVLRGLPVVLMTAASPGTTDLPTADALLPKPFEVVDLLATVGRFLAG